MGKSWNTRLVETDTMSEHLYNWCGTVALVWHAELGADVVSPGGGGITSQYGVSEVPALLGQIQGKC